MFEQLLPNKNEMLQYAALLHSTSGDAEFVELNMAQVHSEVAVSASPARPGPRVMQKPVPLFLCVSDGVLRFSYALTAMASFGTTDRPWVSVTAMLISWAGSLVGFWLISPAGAGLLWEKSTVGWLISFGWNQRANRLVVREKYYRF